MEILNKLKDKEIIIFGEFTLKNGSSSNIYIDLRKIISFPTLLHDIALGLVEKIKQSKVSYDLICGAPYGAIPIATVISQILNIPLIMLRKESKQYGTKKMVEGHFNSNDNVLLIEDVITTGSSVEEAKENLKKENLNVVDVFCIINRQDEITYKNYLYNLKDITTELPLL